MFVKLLPIMFLTLNRWYVNALMTFALAFWIHKMNCSMPSLLVVMCNAILFLSDGMQIYTVPMLILFTILMYVYGIESWNKVILSYLTCLGQLTVRGWMIYLHWTHIDSWSVKLLLAKCSIMSLLMIHSSSLQATLVNTGQVNSIRYHLGI